MNLKKDYNNDITKRQIEDIMILHIFVLLLYKKFKN